MNRNVQAAPQADSGAKLSRPAKSNRRAARIIMNAVEGFGKTSFAAYGPGPAILMSRGETGYRTLYDAGRVPACSCVELTTWQDTLKMLDGFVDKFDNGCLVLDALGGFERLCHEFVCARDFGNDWGEKGFTGFMRGFDVSITEWIGLITRLDRIRSAHGVPIVLLSHTTIKSFRNPLGPDFDRYIADCHPKTWGVSHKWSDEVYFGNFVTVVQEDRQTRRKKGIGGTERRLYTQRCDGFDAKSRYGLPEEITMPNEPSLMWATVFNHIEGSANPPAPEL